MNIFLVDDDADSRHLLRLILEDARLGEVGCAASGAQALELLAAGQDGASSYQPDVMLLNIAMPQLDGIELCRRLKREERFRDVPVLMVSAQRESEVLAQAFSAGAMDYLRKPLDAMEVRIRVGNALRLRSEIDRREKREAELARTARALEQSLAALNADLAAAAVLQRSLLPKAGVRFSGIDVAWEYLPSAGIGGDLLNVMQLTPQTCALYLFDVAGHGVPAALTCVGLHRLLSADATGGCLLDAAGAIRPPDEVAALMNASTQPQGESIQYATMIYGTFDAVARRLRYVQAGHPGLIVMEPESAPRVCRDGDLPIGLMPDARYESRSLELCAGARLVLYSDGVTEAQRGGGGEQFGEQRLLELLRASREATPAQALQDIVSAVRAWSAPADPADDVSLLLLLVH